MAVPATGGEPRRWRRARVQPSRDRRVQSYHNRPPFDLRKCLADALDGQFRLIRRSDVDQQNMVLPGLHEFAEPCFQLGASAPRKAALKDRELKPLAETMHGLEHATPPLIVGNIVGKLV